MCEKVRTSDKEQAFLGTDEMRVTVILSDEEGEIFKAYCEQNGFKKSTLINRLIREHIQNSDFKLQRNLFGNHEKGGN